MEATINVEALKGNELVAFYNKLTGENVKKFSDRNTGLRRVKAAIAAAKPVEVEAKAKVEATKKDAPSKTFEHGSINRRVRFSASAKAEIKGHRQGTKRATLIKLLGRDKGASMAECEAATGWDYKTCYEGIKLLNTYTGYGLSEDEEGRIRLTLK